MCACRAGRRAPEVDQVRLGGEQLCATDFQVFETLHEIQQKAALSSRDAELDDVRSQLDAERRKTTQSDLEVSSLTGCRTYLRHGIQHQATISSQGDEIRSLHSKLERMQAELHTKAVLVAQNAELECSRSELLRVRGELAVERDKSAQRSSEVNNFCVIVCQASETRHPAPSGSKLKLSGT